MTSTDSDMDWTDTFQKLIFFLLHSSAMTMPMQNTSGVPGSICG